jgi:hypothetical protein
MNQRFVLFLPPFTKGPVAEWLGRGLQNLLQRFESARDLKGLLPKKPPSGGFFVCGEGDASLLAIPEAANKNRAGRRPARFWEEGLCGIPPPPDHRRRAAPEVIRSGPQNVAHK